VVSKGLVEIGVCETARFQITKRELSQLPLEISKDKMEATAELFSFYCRTFFSSVT